MTGRARHLEASIICKRWWETYLDSFRESTQQMMSGSESSSEVGSDEDFAHPSNDMAMDVDQELGEFSWYEDYDADEIDCPSSEDDAGFISTPSGVDLRTAELINTAEADVSVEEYPGVAHVISESKNLYSRIWESDELYESRKIGGPFYPFSGSMEWEMAEWLHSLDVPMKKIDRFFELEYVSLRLAFQFEFV